MDGIDGLLKEEMPREKLEKFGPQNLTDVELLAIILRTGTHEKNVLELAREIISQFNVNIVSRQTFYELLEFKGISKAKACMIVATFEFARRLANRGIEEKVKLVNSKEVFDYVSGDFSSLQIEKVLVIFVNTKNQVIKKEFMFEGSINYSLIEPRELIKRALSLNASGFFLLHNHPSNDVKPSQEDILITKRIKEICESLNFRFLDHIIFGENEFYSMFDNDIM